MSKSDSLFRLIKSMSKSEKRNFKIFASRHVIGEKNNYVALFDAIDKQLDYDEKLILQKFKGNKLAKNISSVKVQLNNLILRSLRQFNSGHKKKYDVRQLLDYADIFYEKGMYVEARKMLQKAQKIAKEYDQYVHLDEISILERDIAHKLGDLEGILYQINIVYPELKQIRATNEDLATYEQLISRIEAFNLKGRRINYKVNRDELEEIVNHELLHVKNIDTEPYAIQIDFHTVWGYYHRLLENRKEAVFHRKKILELLESKPQLVVDSPKLWIKHAKSLLITLGHFDMYEDFDDTVILIEDFISKIPDSKKTINLNSEIYSTIYNVTLDMDLDRGVFSKSVIKANKIVEGLEKYKMQLTPQEDILLNVNLAYVYLGAGEYSKALKWTNNGLNTNYGEIRKDLQSFCRIINILIHYELGNYMLIDSLIRSTDRYLQKENRKFEFEKSFLKFAKKHLQEKYTISKLDSFEKQIEEIQTICQDPFEARALMYFDSISWLETKTKGKTMEELMVPKAKDVKPFQKR